MTETCRARAGRVFFCTMFVAAVLTAVRSHAEEVSHYDRRFADMSQRFAQAGDMGARTVLMYRIFDIRYRVSAPEAVAGFLLDAAANDAYERIMRDQALWLASEMALESGDLDATERFRNELGLVDYWAVIGPFDNTAKAGFDTPYPPENELDFSTTYAGKTPFVRWRGIPLENPIGYVDFEELFRPNENATGYAATFVHAAERTPVAVRLGADDVAKVFVNGRLSLAKTGYNHVAFDQVSAGVVLEPGWNAILVKVCQVDERWGFYLRLSAPEGGPASGIRFAASLEEIHEAASEFSASDELEKVAVADVTATLRAAHSSDQASAAANYELGYYLAATHNFDRDKQEQAEFLARAVELAPDNVEYLKALARYGASSPQRQRALRKALALAGDDVEVFAELGDAFARRGFTPDAVRYYGKALAQDARFAQAHLGLAQLLVRQFRYAQALRHLETAASVSPADPETALVTAIVYENLELPEKARAFYRRALEHMAPVSEVNRPYIDLLVEAGKDDEALARYDFLLTVEPLVSAYYRDKARLLWRLGRRDEALGVTRRALDVAPEDEKTLDQLAGFLFETGHADEARAHWTKALVLKPQNAMVREQLDVLARQKSAPEELVARTLAEAEAETSSLKLAPSEYETGAVYLLDVESVNVMDDLVANRFFQQVVKITDKRASDEFRYFPVFYSPSYQQITVRSMDVVRPDGSRLRAKLAGEQGMSNPQYNLYYDYRARIYVFPELQAGDLLDIQYVVRDLRDTNPLEGYFGDVKVFARSFPILKQEYILQWPRDVTLFCRLGNSMAEPVMICGDARKLQLVEPTAGLRAGGAAPEGAGASKPADAPDAGGDNEMSAYAARFEPVTDEKNAAVWKSECVEALRREPSRPGQTEISPYLTVSTFSSWPAMLAWYSNLVREQFVVSGETADEIRRLAEPLPTLEEKVAAIHEFVISNTRYVGLEFGVHGYKPYKSRTVLARRFGDCKDKAALAVTLLRECGIPARMSITRTRMRGRIDLSVPALALFDHAIVAVPKVADPSEAEDYLWVDETADLSTYTELPWMDQEADVVVLDPFTGEGHLALTPAAAPSDNYNRSEYVVRIAPDLSATVARRSSYVGQLAPAVRQIAQDPKQAEKHFERSFNAYYPRARVTDFKVTGIGRLGETPTIEMTFEVPDLVDNRKMELVSSLVPLDLVKRYASLQTRRYAIDLGYPWTQTTVVHFLLPETLEFDSVPDDYESRTDVGSCSVHYERKSVRDLVVTVRVTLDRPKVSASDYPTLRKFAWTVDERLKTPITLRKCK